MRPGWRKSSFSSGSGNADCVEVWWKSSFSGGNADDNCVEVAFTAAPAVAVRDSKNPGATISVPATSWDCLLLTLS